jgi:hypothetical protein
MSTEPETISPFVVVPVGWTGPVPLSNLEPIALQLCNHALAIGGLGVLHVDSGGAEE